MIGYDRFSQIGIRLSQRATIYGDSTELIKRRCVTSVRLHRLLEGAQRLVFSITGLMTLPKLIPRFSVTAV